MAPGMMAKGMMNMMNLEVAYSFTIILISLMIYYGTKELYQLTKHKGIKYFRLAFLYFAIAYFFRSIARYLIITIELPLQLNTQLTNTIILAAFLYTTIMAALYLLYSVLQKRMKKHRTNITILHTTAISTTIITLLLQQSLFYLGINIILLLTLLGITYHSYNNDKKEKKKKNTYTLYALLFTFWALNILDIIIPNFLRETQLLIYLASISVFMTILYKVLKKSGT
jgi:hypothetical protein